MSVALVAMLAPTALAKHDSASFDFDVRAKADLEVEARADGRHQYRWDWGDGRSSVGAAARHTYERPGVYKVVVVAVDDEGREWRRTREVEVRAAAPAVRVDVAVDGPTVRAEAAAERGARYEWDWGDGRASRGRLAAHTYAEPGTYEVTLKVTHRDGSCTYERRTVQVRADAGARHEARARGSGVSASVSLGLGGEETREREERADTRARHEWRSETRVRSSSHEHHEVPGPAG
ncbi:MAG TPA: PKD domain-containing protein [Candidatus Thermoplasmatota archaeon]|nr:PKD domain-containing protein [Candidatus Thermoplasmatota archaeon]